MRSGLQNTMDGCAGAGVGMLMKAERFENIVDCKCVGLKLVVAKLKHEGV